MIESHQQTLLTVIFPEEPQEVQSLSSLLDGCSGVSCPGEVIRHQGAQKFKSVHPLHTISVYVEGGWFTAPLYPEVQY